MNAMGELPRNGSAQAGNHVDVLIVGAGISGVGSAWHVQNQCPGMSYAILERKDTFGGTWDTHKYPGIRSDSDLYTFGYRFKPWVGPPIATAEEILAYMGEVIEENGIGEHIRYGHSIRSCAFSRETGLWTVTAEAGGEEVTYTCRFLWMCSGYYDHENPYIPDWKGVEDFRGLFVHAQKWDPATDYAGKRVLVIGSGATAATVVPEFAKSAAHVTMLQRSPTYFFCHPNQNELADRLREVGIDEETVHRVVRQQILYDQDVLTQRCIDEPEAVFEELKALIREYAGEDFEFEPHFTPRYRVWQQRLAFCPDGDVFQAVAQGKASVVTDTIDRFTEKGVLTSSGEEIEADIIVAATGFRLSVMGDMEVSVDGKRIDWSDTITWRGMMFTGVPNLAWVMGYFRASWTLRVDMMGDLVCRMLNHMRERGATSIEVAPPKGLSLGAWIDADNFNPGYLQRGMGQLPKAGEGSEWRHTQDYWREKDEFPAVDLDGPSFVYRTAKEREVA
ncbi:flavin-containing monooxygenase [Parerythrobacter aestuarii]|uniref:flavin-containing monooxygenase n=1 Tax=Parerythrobacter aestuarii TaxID=3020909 RepID=UPI0024DEF303|nr:NAD(P)/FAD-dependent oxidoreductase [Parerythrobacter aestuarii]